MEADYPGWNATFQAHLAAISTISASSADAAKEWPETFQCRIPYDPAMYTDIKEGIDYLRGLTGTAINDPGKCGRVSCSYNSAIYWCNDNDYQKEVEWGQVADGGKFILDRCANGRTLSVKGRATFAEKFSVWVRKDWC
ncbi:hypothetical protein B0T21DRAFT_357602 [Apiosordaria backusii]|uniref:Uncharacterized protein n=1 Tax=Apiosordaria backusii TaxID=314023 RepID=A0AA40ERZ3_9PEZI|nr:hypothetical protein B0T21DRAFT_357602 [Apiosordaria backusii]